MLEVKVGGSLTLEEAFKLTLLNLYKGPEFVDLKTGLPYETISLTERRPLRDVVTGDDITELHTPYWVYYLATGDEDVKEIIASTIEAMLTFLDPGTGLVGSYKYDIGLGGLSEADTVKQDAEHGGEAPMYSLFPYAWCFKSEKAVRSLENFAKIMLLCNNESGYIHFHLYIERRSDGSWLFKDYGQVATGPDTYCDIMEFWWILPTLEAAVVTKDDRLRSQIIDRVKIVMDNMISLQDKSTGQLPTVYKMDGSSGYWGKWGLDEAWDPSPGAFSRWIQASYIMHNLTSESKYIRALDRFWDWYFKYWNYLGNPEEYATMGEYVFHSYYTGNSTYIPKVHEWALSLGSPETKTVPWMIAKALYYSISGEEEALKQALMAEEEYRKHNFLNYSGYSFYLDSYGHSHASACDVDFLFRGEISNLILLKNRGKEIHGLLYRDLLALGWLIPSLVHESYHPSGRIYETYIMWLREDIKRERLKFASTDDLLTKAEESLHEAVKAYQSGDYIQVKEHVIHGFDELKKYKLKAEGISVATSIILTISIAILVAVFAYWLIKRYMQIFRAGILHKM
jgi:hypothetical protein